MNFAYSFSIYGCWYVNINVNIQNMRIKVPGTNKSMKYLYI